MECKIQLQLTNYNKDTNKKDDILIPLGNIQEDQNISLDIVAQAIAKLSIEDREQLANKLKAARIQKVTEDTIKEHQIMSNISLNDLVKQYPDLKKYNIPEDLQYKFTLLRCYNAQFNGSVYKGRAIDAEGNEVFIINTIWDAEKLFKHLSVKLNLDKYIQGNTIDESLNEYADDLKTLAGRYRKTVQNLIQDFLINKNHYRSFKQGDKLYSPKRIINKALSKITGELFDEGNKSELQLELEAIKEATSSSNEWKLDKQKLYEVLSVFYKDFADQYTLQRFKDLDTESLNNIIRELFANDIKLLKATVKSSAQGEKVIKEAPKEKKKITILSKNIQEMYEYLKQQDEKYKDWPKTYQDAAKKHPEEFKNLKWTYTDENGISYDAYSEIGKRPIVFYEVEQENTVKEKPSYVILNLNNWSPIGGIYDFSYATQPIFKHEEIYKGFYIYKYVKNGVSHYAISRSIISPKAYMKTFASLELAKSNIDSNNDTIKSCGLWSIKQHNGRPRISEIEMKDVREGQIITTLDLQLPRFDYNKFSTTIKELFNGTISNFHDTLSFVDNIKTLDTPEKAAAFIYIIHGKLKSNDDFMEALAEKTEDVQKIINRINSSGTISYMVEKEQKYGSKGTEYYLKILQNNGTNIQLDGDFRDDITIQSFMDQNLTEAINYFNKVYGINIKSFTRSELEQFSKDNNLNLENKLDVVKAFVYNGEVYINTSNANIEDLFHEISHILLGIVKATDVDAYNELISMYTKKYGFKYQFTQHKKTYQHYSEQDIIEETVADMLADEMFKAKQLGTPGFKGDIFTQMFEDLFKKSERFITMKDNKLGFSDYMKTLLNENQNDMQRNMRISELIRQKIKDNVIKEDC